MKSLAFLLTLGVLVLPTLPLLTQTALAQGQDDRFAGGSCHQGVCFTILLLNKQIVHQNQLSGRPNTLYKTSLEIQTFKANAARPDSTRQATEWVYCSASNPYIAFEVPDQPELLFLSYLNPGGEINGTEVSTQGLYWKVCHDRSAGSAEDATALGYALNLPEGQLFIPKVMFAEMSSSP